MVLAVETSIYELLNLSIKRLFFINNGLSWICRWLDLASTICVYAIGSRAKFIKPLIVGTPKPRLIADHDQWNWWLEGASPRYCHIMTRHTLLPLFPRYLLLRHSRTASAYPVESHAPYNNAVDEPILIRTYKWYRSEHERNRWYIVTCGTLLGSASWLRPQGQVVD